MNVCARQFFDCTAWSVGVNGDVMAASDKGELCGIATVLVGDSLTVGRALAIGLASATIGTIVLEPGSPRGRVAPMSSPLLYRWTGGIWEAATSPVGTCSPG